MSIITKGYGSPNLITQGFGPYESLILEVANNDVSGGSSGSYWTNFNKLKEEDKERFIELTLKIKGERIQDKRKIQNIKLTIEDVHMTVETVLKSIKVKVKSK